MGLYEVRYGSAYNDLPLIVSYADTEDDARHLPVDDIYLPYLEPLYGRYIYNELPLYVGEHEVDVWEAEGLLVNSLVAVEFNLHHSHHKGLHSTPLSIRLLYPF